MRSLQIVLVVTVLLCVNLAQKSFGQNLGVFPTTLDFSLGNGQSEAQVINISNGSARKVQFRLYLNDWIRDSLGGHMYTEPSTLPNSASRWVSLSQNFVELEPGKSTQVTVRLAVPDSAAAISSMRWSMLFIETVEEQNAQNSKVAQATVRNLLRIGVHIYQTPPTITTKEVKITDLKPVDTLPNVYNLVCENTGDIMLECKSYLEITSLTSGKKTKVESLDFPLFPKQRRYVRYTMPAGLPKGKYSVLGVIDAGEDISLEAIEAAIDIK